MRSRSQSSALMTTWTLSPRLNSATLMPTTAFAAKYKKQTIMTASANSLTSAHAVTLNKFKEIVEKESEGAIQVKPFLGGSMGDESAEIGRASCRERV